MDARQVVENQQETVHPPLWHTKFEMADIDLDAGGAKQDEESGDATEMQNLVPM